MYNLAAFLIMCACMLTSAAYASSPLRDPTKPPGVTSYETSGGNIRIDAIFFNKDNNGISTVIIGGRKFVVGDKIMDATIIEIKPREIKLKDDNGEYTVTMPHSTIKSPTTKTNKKKKS